MKPTEEELPEILRKHKLWLNDERGGEQANLTCADLSNANLTCANLTCADLSNADLSNADLRWANFSGADMRNANLFGANLTWARMSNASLSNANLIGATGTYYITQRRDGYQFYLCEDDGKYFIRAGCRYMSIADYRRHTMIYPHEWKREETLLILDFAEAKLNLILKKAEAA